MTINSKVDILRDRVRNFLRVNNKVDLTELKLHLECGGMELLLALGGLINERTVELERDGWRIIIKKNNACLKI